MKVSNRRIGRTEKRLFNPPPQNFKILFEPRHKREQLKIHYCTGDSSGVLAFDSYGCHFHLAVLSVGNLVKKSYSTGQAKIMNEIQAG